MKTEPGPAAPDPLAAGAADPAAAFHRVAGALHVEGVRLERLIAAGIPTPFYVYSDAALRGAFARYAAAVAGLDPAALVCYAVKANHNPVLMRTLSGLGAGAVVVSATELRHALATGFTADRMLLHGSGKRREDLDAAIGAGTLISADSEFDLDHLSQRAQALGRRARVLLRVNPDIDPQVHPYISTGLLDSKFGLPESAIEALRPRLRPQRPETPGGGGSSGGSGGSGLWGVAVHGLHCHLGSTLRSVQPGRDAARLVVAWCERLRQDGHPVDTVDLGGGLGIDYRRGSEPMPTPAELVAAMRPALEGRGLRLWLEPGRSLVGPAGALVGRVLGVKHTARKRFVVTDASMAQLIRPCLYGAYHHIELLDRENPTEVAPAAPALYDVVGPVCESGDFLGEQRPLPPPQEGEGLIVYDAGAYGFAMASRYNLNLFCAEYLVRGTEVRCIRRAETYEDFVGTFADEGVGGV